MDTRHSFHSVIRWAALALVLLLLLILAPSTTSADDTPLSRDALADAGAERLDDAALKELVIGSTWRARNLSTGQEMEFTFYKTGQRLIRDLTPLEEQPPQAKGFFGGSVLGGLGTYRIADNRLMTTVDGSAFTSEFYKLDDAYYVARDTDRGAANWRLVERYSVDARIFSDETIRQLLVGRTVTLRNRATLDSYTIHWGKDGVRTVTGSSITRADPHVRPLAKTADYKIEEGMLTTTVGGESFQVRFYQLDATPLAMRFDRGRAIIWEVIEIY